MSRRVRIGLPLLVGGVVFAIGAVLEIDSFTWFEWMFCLIGGLMTPGGLLALAYFGMYRTARAYFRHAHSGSPQEEVGWYSAVRPRVKGSGVEPETPWGARVEGIKYAAITGGLVGLALTACGFVFWKEFARFPNPPVYWFLTAITVGLLTALCLRVIRLKRSVLTAALTCGAAAVCLMALPYWKRGRDSSHYQMLLDRASHGSDRHRLEAADRLVAFRPDDWRGYAWRVDARIYLMHYDSLLGPLRSGGRTDPETALNAMLVDLKTAVRLGCDDPTVRENFADVYQALGQYAEAAAELEAALELGVADATQPGWFNPRTVCRDSLGWARLHNGEYAAAEAVFRPIASYEGLGLTLLARGEYAAMTRLPDDSRYKNGTLTLAWLLATCPDDAIRDPGRAVEIVRAIKPAELWIGARDSERPLAPHHLGWAGKMRDGAAQRAKAFVLAAAYTNLDRFDEAEKAYQEATAEGRLGHHGFWKSRRVELGACIKARKPFREQPAK